MIQITNFSLPLRPRLALYGTLHGLAFYLVFDVFEKYHENWLFMLVSATIILFFASLLVLTGPLNAKRAAIFSALSASIAAILLTWAAFRFASPQDAFAKSDGRIVLAAIALTLLPMPFILAAAQKRNGWRTYDLLFDIAWSIAVRLAAATCFSALFVGVLFLADTMLKLVDIDQLGKLIARPYFTVILSGCITGLCLAILHEMGSTLSTLRRLVLKLLQLLLPFVAIVVALFLVRAPAKGLSALFGNNSAGLMLMGAAIGSICLISAALESSDQEAASSALMIWATKILAVLTPFLAALALYAIWLRVDQYGFTPGRVFSTLAALSILAYGLIYAAATLAFGHRWRAIIRNGNTFMALTLIALSALWLTPALNPQAISAKSQIARFLADTNSLSNLDLWKLGNDWGKAGKSVLETIKNKATNDPALANLVTRIAKVEQTKFKSDLPKIDPVMPKQLTRKNQINQIIALLPAAKTEIKLTPSAFARLRDDEVETLANSCQQQRDNGQPNCLPVGSNFLGQTQDQIFIFYIQNIGGIKTHRSLCQFFLQKFDAPDGAYSQSRCTQYRIEDAHRYMDALAAGNFAVTRAKLFQIDVEGIAILPPTEAPDKTTIVW